MALVLRAQDDRLTAEAHGVDRGRVGRAQVVERFPEQVDRLAVGGEQGHGLSRVARRGALEHDREVIGHPHPGHQRQPVEIGRVAVGVAGQAQATGRRAFGVVQAAQRSGQRPGQFRGQRLGGGAQGRQHRADRLGRVRQDRRCHEVGQLQGIHGGPFRAR
ncbi:hypothetical protein [Actinosynnema sp. ALI-1.44]|uniref:hypothetical protein n=1 Tax=Actinosynnema sp. ALI-1.44 TaxID=1933779 RepID=UPI001877219A|nr:hypothetical protein [Actinosynnema sp. ALI-1.44]